MQGLLSHAATPSIRCNASFAVFTRNAPSSTTSGSRTARIVASAKLRAASASRSQRLSASISRSTSTAPSSLFLDGHVGTHAQRIRAPFSVLDLAFAQADGVDDLPTEAFQIQWRPGRLAPWMA